MRVKPGFEHQSSWGDPLATKSSANLVKGRPSYTFGGIPGTYDLPTVPRRGFGGGYRPNKYGYWAFPPRPPIEWRGPPDPYPFKPFTPKRKSFGKFGHDPFITKKARNRYLYLLRKSFKLGRIVLPGLPLGLIPLPIRPGDPLGPYYLPGDPISPSGTTFRECGWTFNWTGQPTFLVDQGEVLGEPLTCLSGQAIFSSNFADAPSNHRNLALMRPYWVVEPPPEPGLKRTASVWVKHTPAGETVPHPFPQPAPLGAPGGSDGFPKPAPNPYDPEAQPILDYGPEPQPLPWREAVGNRPRHPESESMPGGRARVPDLIGGGNEVPAPSWSSDRPRPRPTHVRARPRPRVRERKQGLKPSALMRFMRRFAGLYYAYTEVDDMIDAFIKSIPPKYVMQVYGRWPRNVMEKAEVLYAQWRHINPAKAIKGLAENQIEDWAIGKFGSATKRGTKSAAQKGYWNRPVGTQTGGWKFREVTRVEIPS